MDEQNTINTDISAPSSGMSSGDKRVIIGTIALFVLCVTGYAFSVDNFKDYKPPSYLAIGWYDYYVDSLMGGPSSDNKKTPWTRWSVEYPYRAMFLGAYPGYMQEQRYNAVVYIVWSKKPVTDIFTFEFRDGDLSAGKKGRIRALYDKGITNRGDDVYISYTVHGGMPEGTLVDWHLSDAGTYVYAPNYIDGDKAYFEFDFYYDCTDKHQQNSKLLNISGLRGISDVPYAYILTCGSHGGDGGATSGDDSSGGSSGGGSSSSSSSSDDDEFIGKIVGGYESSSGLDYKEAPWPTPGYDDDTVGHGDDEGDTGEKGDTWELPSFNLEDDLGVSGEADGSKELKPGTDDWGYEEMKPGGGVEQGYEEMNPGGGVEQGYDEMQPGGGVEQGYEGWEPNGEYGLTDFMNM